MRRIVSFGAIALALAAPAGGVTGSGLYGVVMRGPIVPVCSTETPCDAPAAGVRLFFARNGSVKSVVTSSLGRYRIVLVPGTYTVRTGSATAIGRGLEPRAVVVPAGWKRQAFSIDTGIR
jgi:hypothetical protein